MKNPIFIEPLCKEGPQTSLGELKKMSGEEQNPKKLFRKKKKWEEKKKDLNEMYIHGGK